MKIRKISLLAIALFAVVSTAFYSCKKNLSENGQKPTAQSLADEATITVNTLGFLSFTDVYEAEDLITWLASGTHADAKAFFANNNFSPLALTMYNSSYDNNMVTAEEAPYYLLSSATTVQMAGVVMKLSDDNDFVTTLTGSNITGSNYESLESGEFDDMIMNRFPAAIDGTNSAVFSQGFFAFNNTTPTGYDDDTPPPPISERRIFWGKIRNCDDVGGGLFDCHDDRYIFWIRVKRGDSDFYPIAP